MSVSAGKKKGSASNFLSVSSEIRNAVKLCKNKFRVIDFQRNIVPLRPVPITDIPLCHSKNCLNEDDPDFKLATYYVCPECMAQCPDFVRAHCINIPEAWHKKPKQIPELKKGANRGYFQLYLRKKRKLRTEAIKTKEVKQTTQDK